MADFAERRTYKEKWLDAMGKANDKNMEAEMMGEEASYTIQDFWPEYNDEIQAKLDEYNEIYKYFNRVYSYLYEDLPGIYDGVISNAELFQQEYIAYGMSADSYEYRYQSDVIDIYSVNKNLPIRIEDR